MQNLSNHPIANNYLQYSLYASTIIHVYLQYPGVHLDCEPGSVLVPVRTAGNANHIQGNTTQMCETWLLSIHV